MGLLAMGIFRISSSCGSGTGVMLKAWLMALCTGLIPGAAATAPSTYSRSKAGVGWCLREAAMA